MQAILRGREHPQFLRIITLWFTWTDPKPLPHCEHNSKFQGWEPQGQILVLRPPRGRFPKILWILDDSLNLDSPHLGQLLNTRYLNGCVWLTTYFIGLLEFLFSHIVVISPPLFAPLHPLTAVGCLFHNIPPFSCIERGSMLVLSVTHWWPIRWPTSRLGTQVSQLDWSCTRVAKLITLWSL